ncbi:hypothetical protein PEX1_051860 [Penicillium expansum]|uniref:Uncharacterized protein n=1 Tax=Penicillium expansum TaxID=27334 RepID=A0A0A2KEP3_PENEN|nr:hypothetical protein PEX2_017280 [Penicillium expansum]KGO38476.1 hypothetical protein PEXP_055540 [Penicillium expansum]KGO61822.1 hypothetical protein PEX2_017280 [Penicillium expansum]KGO66282.1 hypothetical protein PEX1_051860 [Penicillium expansum]
MVVLCLIPTLAERVSNGSFQLKNRSDLVLAPFSIFVIVCRCRVLVRAMLAAFIELSLSLSWK